MADLIGPRAVRNFPQETNCSTETRTPIQMKIIQVIQQVPIQLAALFPGLRVRILLGAEMSVSCQFCVSADSGLCVGLITRPEES
jgi:hypothetical protein